MIDSNYLENPYNSMGLVPEFSVSTSFKEGDKLPVDQVSGIMGAGGKDISPALTWEKFPKDTKSFAVTMFDPDAPTASGFWHWLVVNIPPSCNFLPEDAGNPEKGLLPSGAVMLKNDAGLARYIGAAPPSGQGEHRYFYGIHALKVESLDFDLENVTGAQVGFSIFESQIARASIYARFAQ